MIVFEKGWILTKFKLKILCSNCIYENNESCLINSKFLTDLDLQVLKFKPVDMKTNCIEAVIETENIKDDISHKIFDKYPGKIKQIIISKKLF